VAGDVNRFRNRKDNSKKGWVENEVGGTGAKGWDQATGGTQGWIREVPPGAVGHRKRRENLAGGKRGGRFRMEVLKFVKRKGKGEPAMSHHMGGG